MNYNDRVDLVTTTTVPGYLDEDIVESETETVPCYKSPLTNNEQIGIFGKYSQEAFKLHIQGIHKGFTSIEYGGIERSIYSTKFHRNSTVVVLM